MLDALRKAYAGFVIVNPQSDWTLGELANAESVAGTAR